MVLVRCHAALRGTWGMPLWFTLGLAPCAADGIVPPVPRRAHAPSYRLNAWSSRSATAIILHADFDTEMVAPRVVFHLDGVELGAAETNPYYLALELRKLGPGTHAFFAEAYLADTRIATSAKASFQIGPIRVLPAQAVVLQGQQVQFSMQNMDGLPEEGDWSLEGHSYPGTITRSGLYTAPLDPGSYRVIAGNPFDPAQQSVAQVTVQAPAATGPAPGREEGVASGSALEDQPPAESGPPLELHLKAARIVEVVCRAPDAAKLPLELTRQRIGAASGAEAPLVRALTDDRLIDDQDLLMGATYRYALRDSAGREWAAATLATPSIRVTANAVQIRWDPAEPPLRIAIQDKGKRELRSAAFQKDLVFDQLSPGTTYFLSVEQPSGPPLQFGFQTLVEAPFIYASSVSATPGSRLRFYACNPHPERPVIIRIGAANPGPVTPGRPLRDSGPVPVAETTAPYDGAVYGYDWPEVYTWDVPPGQPSGLYYASIGYADRTARERIPIVIEPAAKSRKPVLVLANSFTWQAYNTFGGLSFYTQPIEFPFPRKSRLGSRFAPMPEVSLRRPLRGADPLDYMTHTAGAERFLLDWLDQNHVGYDLVTDRQLGALRPEELLKRYKTLVIQVHPEYLSEAERDLVHDYLAQGGNVIVLAGNTMYCQVAIQGSPERLVRLMRPVNTRKVESLIGEFYRGWSKFMNDYVITQPGHWAFQGLGARQGDHLGQGGPWGGGNGWEMDTPGTYSLARMTLLAHGDRTLPKLPDTGIVLFTTPGGGTLVNVGSIVFTSTLKADPMAAGFLRNLLARFGAGQ